MIAALLGLSRPTQGQALLRAPRAAACCSPRLAACCCSLLSCLLGPSLAAEWHQRPVPKEKAAGVWKLCLRHCSNPNLYQQGPWLLAGLGRLMEVLKCGDVPKWASWWKSRVAICCYSSLQAARVGFLHPSMLAQVTVNHWSYTYLSWKSDCLGAD